MTVPIPVEETDYVNDRGRTARRLIGELRPHRRELGIAGIWVLIGATAQALTPALIGETINGPIADGDSGALLRWIIGLVVLALIGAVATRFQVIRVGVIGQKVLAGFRQGLFDQFQRLPLKFFGKQPIGDLVSRVSSDVDTINQFVSQGLSQSVGQVVGLIATMVAMVVLDWKMALVSFTIIPILLFTTTYVSRRARIAYRLTRRTIGTVTASLQEEISGIRETQAYNRADYNIERFRGQNRDNYDAYVRATKISSALAPAVEVMNTVATGVVLAYGGWQVYRGDLEIGTLAAFLIYVQTFFRPIQLITQVYTQLQSSLAGAERIYAILDTPAEQPDRAEATDIQDARGALRFESVNFGYDPGRPILKDISVDIAAGQTVAVVGPTGAGKTTLVNLIPRFYELDDDSGRITLDGQDTRLIRKDSLREQISLVLQEPFLFAGTIRDNIAYGRPDATAEEIEAAARAVQAEGFIKELDGGFDTVLDEGGGGLSEGQRQLLTFARAVLADPRILILDEATSRIDTRTEALIQTAIQSLLHGRTSIVIAHRLSTVRNADLILVMADGRIVEQGRHDELIRLDGLYATLYQRQMSDTKRPPQTIRKGMPVMAERGNSFDT
ncbi:MAG TPA: ABC transporter ATP-binding protein [Thermomicrobiales bacterium]|jgi:ATP-binding cassette subfamily B protein/subfamily B ATP-binding cassette protein MsbA|nr:ABC transporter ATP-binding protein [Thermomicrobiales bacterium]